MWVLFFCFVSVLPPGGWVVDIMWDGNEGRISGLVFGFGFGFAWAFGGIRDMPSYFRRCPCAGRHLLSLPPQRK
jgi:hypothetical protein